MKTSGIIIFQIILFAAGTLIVACQKPVRDNPWDIKASPDSWAPQNFTMKKNDTSSIKLEWEQNIAVEGFKIERKTENDSWQTLSSNINGRQRQFTDTNTDFSNEYFYRIKAFVKSNFSSYTEAFVISVTNPTTGKNWMDRNLGAKRVAQNVTDELSYGDLYQWGRGTDGHEKRNSGTTSALSPIDIPGHLNFIIVASSPYDWRSPQNSYLWQGVKGTNNPCPPGYRLPTLAEWQAERQIWSSNNEAGAFASPLKLPIAGYRNSSNAALGNVGSSGYYWSATVDGTNAWGLYLGSSGTDMYSNLRAYGNSVRCIKD